MPTDRPPRKILAPLLGALLLCWGQAPTPAVATPLECYTCRTAECPELPAPPCRPKKQKPKPLPSVTPGSEDRPAPDPAPPVQPKEPDPPPPPPPVRIAPPAQERSLRPLAISTLVGGVILGAAGGALLGVNGTPLDCWAPGDPTTCQHVLRTQTAGAVLVTTGGAALITATVLFIVKARR